MSKPKKNAALPPALEGARRRQAMKDELLGGRSPGEVMKEQLAPNPPPPPPAIDLSQPSEIEFIGGFSEHEALEEDE